MRQLFWAVFRGVNGFSKHFSSIATQLKFQVFFSFGYIFILGYVATTKTDLIVGSVCKSAT